MFIISLFIMHITIVITFDFSVVCTTKVCCNRDAAYMELKQCWHRESSSLIYQLMVASNPLSIEANEVCDWPVLRLRSNWR